MDFLGNRDRVQHYFSIKNGKVVKSLGSNAPDNMEGITKRTNKDGDVVYEIVADYIRGRIIELGLQQPPEDKKDYKELMVITLEVNGKKCIVQMPFDSSYGRGFLNAAEGIDFGSELELEPYKYYDKKSGRDKMGCTLYQFGNKLGWTKGTRDKPGDVPELEEVIFKGEKAWDNTKQLAYYHAFYADLQEKIEQEQVLDDPDDMEVPLGTGVDF